MTTEVRSGRLARYLANNANGEVNPAAAAVYAGLDVVGSVSPTVSSAIVSELQDQRSHLKLIASENYSSLATQLAHGNLFIDKYA